MAEEQTDPQVTEEDIRTALRITPLFYDAVLDPSHWQTALKELTDWFPGSRGSAIHLFRHLPDMTTEQYLHVNFGFTKEETARHLAFEDYHLGDPRTRPYLTNSLNKPVHCRQIVSDDEWYNSPIYKQVFEPCNIDYSVLFGLLYEEENIQFSGGIFRPTSAGPFNDHDVSKLQLLIPHMRRAGAVYARIMGVEEKSRQLEQVLEDIGLATIFVDEKGRVLKMNLGARELAERGDGLIISDNKINHEQTETAVKLKSLISDVVGCVATGQPARVHHVDLPRRSNTRPLQATVCSLTSNPNKIAGWIQNQLQVAIFITDPMQSYESRLEKLQRLYGLTSAEARVLEALVDGATPQDIAEKNKRSIETVRRHIKNIMAKTHTHRQADLVRLVLSAE